MPFAVVVDGGTRRRDDVSSALAGVPCACAVTSVAQSLDAIARHVPDLVIVAAGEHDSLAAIESLRRLRAAFTYPRYIFVADVSSEDLAIAALHAGAERYIREPWSSGSLQHAATDLLPACGAESDELKGGDRLVGRSPPIVRLRAQLARVARTASNVMILGETGTGKELAAELLHLNGARASKPFVCLNTAAIPDALVENELFGHERGAFTGATEAHAGKLAAANGGTVFLDEIGDVSMVVQAKLLRAIESRTIYRLGGTKSVPLDVRIVAATNQDLERAAGEGRFRKDLYYRLNVVRVELPPLRERPEDVPLLVNHYLRQLNREHGTAVRGLSARGIAMLCDYQWPGNVRELRNVIETLLVNLAPQTTGIVDVPPEVIRQLAVAVGAPPSERERLLNALTATKWNKSKAATQLHCSRMTLYRRIQRYKIAAK